MTKIRIMSDLHTEFDEGHSPLRLEPAGEDLLLLSGDIGVGLNGIIWADEQAKNLGVPIMYIAGNHEFYRQDMPETYKGLAEYAAGTDGRVTFLQDQVAVFKGLRIFGSTLWTDFDLFGRPDFAMRMAERGMNDFRLIKVGPRPFHPIDAQADHRRSLAALKEQLLLGPIDVVMTHHTPSKLSIHGRYAADEVSPAYASNLDEFVKTSGVKLWTHGHVHHTSNYELGDTKIRTNPRGYVRYEENSEFDPQLIIEV